MSPTLMRVLLTLMLCLVLGMAVYVMKFQPVGSMIAAAVFVVLVLGLWTVRSIATDLAKKVKRTSAQDLVGDARAFIKAVLKRFDAKAVEKIRADAQDLILVTLDEVEKGKFRNSRKAAETLKSIPTQEVANVKGTKVISSSLARLYVMANSFDDSDEADDTKNMIDNFIAGISDPNLMK